MEQLDFGVLLGLAYNQFVAELHDRLAEEGFTGIKPAFGFAFKVLQAERLTTSELAARLGITPQGAAKTVEEMAAAGYVTRIPDPADKRVRRLALTERCRSLLAAAHEFHAGYEQRLAAELGPAKVAVLREVLDAITARATSPDGLARTLRQI
jgi:DNA-binding MarR family transcriptional regulator